MNCACVQICHSKRRTKEVISAFHYMENKVTSMPGNRRKRMSWFHIRLASKPAGIATPKPHNPTYSTYQMKKKSPIEEKNSAEKEQWHARMKGGYAVRGAPRRMCSNAYGQLRVVVWCAGEVSVLVLYIYIYVVSFVLCVTYTCVSPQRESQS